MYFNAVLLLFFFVILKAFLLHYLQIIWLVSGFINLKSSFAYDPIFYGHVKKFATLNSLPLYRSKKMCRGLRVAKGPTSAYAQCVI